MSEEPIPSSREQCCQTSICLVLLVGIPGSGKSHLRKLLEKYFKNTSKIALGSLKIVSVSYDEFDKVRNPTQCSDSVSWKEERLDIFKMIESIVGNIQNNTPLENLASLDKLFIINADMKNPDVVLFLIDDNMYYCSMRYEYYKLAKTCGLSFCQIFFDATKEDALKYNKLRDSECQVPDSVIGKMYEKLEPPDKTNAWEENLITLTPYKKFEENGDLDNILAMIKTAIMSPVQANPTSMCREESLKINNSNSIHQIDIALKQLLGEFIKRKTKVKTDNLSVISKCYSERRLLILKEIKCGKIALPVDLSQPVSSQDIELIKPLLSELLNSTLDS